MTVTRIWRRLVAALTLAFAVAAQAPLPAQAAALTVSAGSSLGDVLADLAKRY